eukprot:m.311433 g.311433  ORF g.311433 m.311433 type:complete len:168 (+) comp19652_c1_seq9:1753-2256(+)
MRTELQWNVENVFEELDAPMEWFYDEDTGKLYYYHNGTGAPPIDTVFEATKLKVLFNISGTQAAPVNGITIRGIKLTGAALSYFEPHGLPSDGGGDWALARSGAVFIEGSQNTLIDGCKLERLDGNAVRFSCVVFVCCVLCVLCVLCLFVSDKNCYCVLSGLNRDGQ